MSEQTQFKVGDKVRLLGDIPHVGYFKATVHVVQDAVGKTIGLKLDEPAIGGHSLDGELATETVSNTGQKFGRGWWVTADSIEKLEE